MVTNLEALTVPSVGVDGVGVLDRAEPAGSMREAYTQYFTSGYYAARYPSVSAFILRRVLKALQGCRRVLDFGCGNGRYLLPLLEQSDAEYVGYDICPAAIEQTRARLADHPARDRVTLVCGDIREVPPCDGAISMFGVLSHIPTRAARLDSLRSMRRIMGDASRRRLVVTVPNMYRRFWKAMLAVKLGMVPKIYEGKPLETNDIIYSRVTEDNQVLWLYYHLYRPATLRRDLEDAGFTVRSLTPESLFTESDITHSARLARLDEVARRVAPAGLGYGIFSVCD